MTRPLLTARIIPKIVRPSIPHTLVAWTVSPHTTGLPALVKRRGRTTVSGPATHARTQNGHIRNDTRDVSRRISGARSGPICRRNCVASDRACTRVTPQNLHGKECDEEGPPRLAGSGLSSGSYREEARVQCCTLVWI